MRAMCIVDTTLRDGEQAPGVAFSLREKVVIARLLDFFGVDIIEAGTPAMGEIEQAAISAISGLGLHSRVTTWNRLILADIRSSLACGVRDIHISAPVSEIQIKYKLGKTRQWVLDCAKRALCYAGDYGCRVSVGAEDASRADPSFVEEFAFLAREMGADRFRFADTVGVMDPFAVYERLNVLSEKVQIDLEFHGHNDFGLATANCIAAVKAGVRYVDVTVGGLGERAGNADLRNFIRTFNYLFGGLPQLRLNMLNRLESLVATAANRNRTGGQFGKGRSVPVLSVLNRKNQQTISLIKTGR